MPRRTRRRLAVAAVLACLAVALLGVPAAQAHRVRPAVATLAFDTGGGCRLHLTLNVEAMLAGTGTAPAPGATGG